MFEQWRSVLFYDEKMYMATIVDRRFTEDQKNLQSAVLKKKLAMHHLVLDFNGNTNKPRLHS